MIRRNAVAADGSSRWILIPQIAHAHLAGQLADAWHFGQLPGELLGDLRHAVRHHDDGWAEWDQRPGVDPGVGVPVNFDEMRLADSLSIWERSIELSTIHAPLAGYLVAGHFCRLLGRFDSWRHNPATQALATRFLATQAARMDALLAAWPFSDQAQRPRELAELGVSLVQLFDAISLWFCCAPRHEPWEARLPDGRAWTFTPIATSAAASRQSAERVSVDPWPLDRPGLTVTAAGRSVAQAHYRTTDELMAAPSEPVEPSWELIPGGSPRLSLGVTRDSNNDSPPA